jgi:hypothetical protein
MAVNFTTAPHEWSAMVTNPDGATSARFHFLVAAPPYPRPTVETMFPFPLIGSFAAQDVAFYGSGSDPRTS